MGATSQARSTREAPAQAELRPTCAGPAMSKRQRVGWASCVNLHLILRAMGLTRGSSRCKRSVPLCLVPKSKAGRFAYSLCSILGLFLSGVRSLSFRGPLGRRHDAKHIQTLGYDIVALRAVG
jgi:hypothetical protein